jgi:hypothetical protein
MTEIIAKIIAGIAALSIIVGIILFNASSNSFSWSWFSSIGDDTLETKDVKQIEMYGVNGRVYPFNFEDRRCVAVTTSEGVGVSCWKLETKDIK